jgi:8-oxo-dGTP diphosphatase
LYVVRHAEAGSRHDFDGDDRDRPLTNEGRNQATALAARLASMTPSGIVSSPYVRCVETVEPLAVAIDVEVRTDDRLAEFTDEAGVGAIAEVLDCIRHLPDRAVVCSHGDVIPALIEALVDGGTCLVGTPEWGKGSVWVIERDGHRFTSAHAWPPPEVD